jgi:hypothetical protein
MARAEQAQAKQLTGTDASTAAQAQAQAQGTYSNLNPFLENELKNPQGYSQQALTSMLGAGMAGTGGATSGVTGQAALEQARTRNASGFSGALDAAQRERGQQNASASEGVAANNAQLQQQQQQSAAGALQGMYGTQSGDALKALGQQNDAINTDLAAGRQGWLQNGLAIADTAAKVGTAAAGLGYKPFGG